MCIYFGVSYMLKKSTPVSTVHHNCETSGEYSFHFEFPEFIDICTFIEKKKRQDKIWQDLNTLRWQGYMFSALTDVWDWYDLTKRFLFFLFFSFSASNTWQDILWSLLYFLNYFLLCKTNRETDVHALAHGHSPSKTLMSTNIFCTRAAQSKACRPKLAHRKVRFDLPDASSKNY